MTNQQTTTYLYQFVAQDDATKKFREYLANLRQYESEMRTTMSQMDRVMSGAGGLPSGTQAISRTWKDGKLAASDFRKELQGVDSGLIQTQRQYDNFGQAINRTTTASFTNADGVREMYRVINTDATPGKMQLRSYNEQVRDGSTYSKEWTVHFNDQLKSVARGKEVYDKSGQSLGKFATVSYQAEGGLRVTKVAIDDLNKVMNQGSLLGERFVRHLTWIGQGIVVWAGINAVGSAIRGWYEAQVDLNTALADFEVRTGAIGSQLSAYKAGILEASTTTGLPLGEVAAVAPFAPDASTLKFAAELNRVAGGNLQNQMQWLVAQQRQFNVEGENTSRILDAVAAGYSLVTLPM
jgi:hypothetical protein